jgi:hypothetical protein
MAKRELNLDKLPSNNIEDEAVTSPDRITKGKVVKSKKKVQSTFYSDINLIISNLYEDVIMPGIKSGITEFVQRGIEMIIWPDGGGTSRNRGRGGGNTNYTNIQRSRNSGAPRRSRQTKSKERRNTSSLQDVYFVEREDAEFTLGELMEYIAKYGMATVAEFYSLSGVTGDHIDHSWMWEDLSSARIRHYAKGYLIELPDPLYSGGG